MGSGMAQVGNTLAAISDRDNPRYRSTIFTCRFSVPICEYRLLEFER